MCSRNNRETPLSCSQIFFCERFFDFGFGTINSFSFLSFFFVFLRKKRTTWERSEAQTRPMTTTPTDILSYQKKNRKNQQHNTPTETSLTTNETAQTMPRPTPKKKICCACPETKRVRDECVIRDGIERCSTLIDQHLECLRSEGFDV